MSDIDNIKQIEKKDEIRLISDENPVVTTGVVEGTPASTTEHVTVINVHPQRRWAWVIASALVALLVVFGAFFAIKQWNYYHNYGVSVSVTPEQNIAKLKRRVKPCTPEVVMTTDSVLGVQLNFYELKGLKATIELDEPAITDKNVYLYSRCADISRERKFLGSLVIGGKVYSDDQSRLGYFGAVDSAMVIGISRFEDVRDYCVEHEGYYFRQFMMLSCGELPSKFYLHGKVERRAIGRKEGNDNLFYIEAPNPETMYDFADAMREYGFVDAIYITGGKTSSYYRTRGGVQHVVGDTTQRPRDPIPGPWLVFRKQ